MLDLAVALPSHTVSALCDGIPVTQGKPITPIRPDPARVGHSSAGSALAVLILAKDEARVLSETVADAIAQVGACGQVHVVADGCRDATASVARAAGARVFERGASGAQGKGAALDWWLRQTHAGSPAGQVVILLDADSRMEPGCIPALHAALESGADAAQAQIVPVLESDSPIALLAALSEIAEQRIGDALRTRLSWPVRLRGTGMAMRRGLLESIAPGLMTSVEDAELTLQVASHGLSSRWVASARVRDPKPANARYAAQQRARWLRGQLQLLRAQPEALTATFRRGLPGWSVLSSVLLKPRAFVLPLGAGIDALLWSLATAGPWLMVAAVPLTLWLAWNAAVVLAAVAWTEHPRRTLHALIISPAYVVLWVTSALLALRSSEPWLRARPALDMPTRPAGEPGHVP
jgi:cellulose synthase/poly-beta-1,6-N-acetylglucosamine synthase-like glycosyltransferase